MAHETVGPQALLDNAFLFSAARLRESRRNVNILGLSALVDAIVMHQRLTVDTRGWNYFEQNVPPQWLPYIQPLLDIIDYKLPTMETVVKTLITDPRVLLTCYLLSEVDFSDFGASPKEPNGKLFDINYYYLTYTGSEIADDSDEKWLLDAINIYRPKNIPEMQFNQRWSDHISTLQCLVRALQYDAFAAQRGEAYLSQEFRGRVLNALSQYRSVPQYRASWDKVMAKVSAHIKKEFNEQLDWTPEIVGDSHALWLRLETPIFLTMALQKCDTAKNLFSCVAEIRGKAQPIRELLQILTTSTSSTERNEAALEMRRLSYELAGTKPQTSDTKLSVSVGYPMSASLGIDIPIHAKSRCVSFIRDIYDNYAIPYTLVEDIKRCFKFDVVQQLTDKPFRDLSDGENLLSGAVYGVGAS